MLMTALVVAWTDEGASARRLVCEAESMTDPQHPLAIMCRATACGTKKSSRTLTASRRSKLASSTSIREAVKDRNVHVATGDADPAVQNVYGADNDK